MKDHLVVNCRSVAILKIDDSAGDIMLPPRAQKLYAWD